MKKIILALALLSLTGFTFGQKTEPKKTNIKQVQVTGRVVTTQPASKAYLLDLTQKGTIYNLGADVDYSRVQVRTSQGQMTMAELLKKTGKTITGKLRVGMTSDIKTQKLVLSRVGGGRLNFNCDGLLCSCSGDADCTDMFTNAACGDIAVCDERGCWCLRI